MQHDADEELHRQFSGRRRRLSGPDVQQLYRPGQICRMSGGQRSPGVNALFTNIISMLALAELGLGTGLIYKLYKPVADHDVPRIQSLLRFYKRAYMIIGAVIAAAGLVLSFYVYLFDKDRYLSRGYMGLTFFLFVLDVLASYLFANQKALITADQKNYIINIAHAGSAAGRLPAADRSSDYHPQLYPVYRGKNRLPGRGRAGDFPAVPETVSGYLP